MLITFQVGMDAFLRDWRNSALNWAAAILRYREHPFFGFAADTRFGQVERHQGAQVSHLSRRDCVHGWQSQFEMSVER